MQNGEFVEIVGGEGDVGSGGTGTLPPTHEILMSPQGGGASKMYLSSLAFLLFSYFRFKTICLFQFSRVVALDGGGRSSWARNMQIRLLVSVEAATNDSFKCRYTVADMHLSDCFFLALALRLANDTLHSWLARKLNNVRNGKLYQITKRQHKCSGQIVVTAILWNVSEHLCICRYVPACPEHNQHIVGGIPAVKNTAECCQAHLCCALFKLLNLPDNLPRKWKLTTDVGWMQSSLLLVLIPIPRLSPQKIQFSGKFLPSYGGMGESFKFRLPVQGCQAAHGWTQVGGTRIQNKKGDPWTVLEKKKVLNQKWKCYTKLLY